MRILRSAALAMCFALAICPLSAQPPKKAAQKSPPPFQSQSQSTIRSTPTSDGFQTIEIHNVTYEITNPAVPGRPRDQLLLLRKTVNSKETLGDIGVDAKVTLEAWPFGDDLRQKPLYTIDVSGTDGRTMDNAIFVVSRGLEEVDWWSVYRLGTGQHLFDTYLPLISFSISRDTLTNRYVGVEVPPDDATDARLKQPNVIGVVTYASEDRVLHEALLVCDDAKRATLLRSYADVTRKLSYVEGPPAAQSARGKGAEPTRAIKLSFSENYPSAPNTLDLLIPIQGDDLDLAHLQLPAKFHLSAWRR